jgi:hypothetical protein
MLLHLTRKRKQRVCLAFLKVRTQQLCFNFQCLEKSCILLENYQIQTKIPMQTILLVNYSDIYQHNTISLFPLIFNDEIFC